MARTLEQILATEKPEVVIQAREAADEMLLNIHLTALKEKMNAAQAIPNPKLSELESLQEAGKALKLSALKEYIEASGGQLRLDVELPDGSHYGFSV